MKADRDPIETVRRFNRLYTKQIGLLREGLLATPFSLSEARVLYEIAQHEAITATSLSSELCLDTGYLSRMLKRFRHRDLVEMRRSETDRRKNLLSLTGEGERLYAELDAASTEDVRSMLDRLAPNDRDALIRCMVVITEIFASVEEEKVTYVLRPHRSGDMGWVLRSHARIYGDEFGWNDEFEALVAEIVADFMRHFDSSRERCWIAEKDGENVGSVFVVKHPNRPGVARLRLLIVDPRARGLGIGRRLVRECTLFARQVGYRRITLWTNSVLHAARRIYEDEGYQMVDEELHHSYGHALTGQTWEMEL